AHHDPAPARDARADVAEERLLAEPAHRRVGREHAATVPRTTVNEKRPPAFAVWRGDLNLVTRWGPCAPLQASSSRRRAHHGATAGPRVKDVGSRLPYPSRTVQGTS